MKLLTLLASASLALSPVAALAQTPAPAPVSTAPAIPGVKNIIVIINDGAGYTVYDAARLYLGHNLVTDGPAFRQIGVSTYPLRPDSSANNRPQLNGTGKNQDPSTVYSSARFWDTTPVAGPSTAAGYQSYPAGFRGYEFSRFAHPDSGNTASSLASGVRTYNNAINVDGEGASQTAITDIIFAANQVGKSAGVVTTVQFSDATPAALGGAHNVARANRTAIAAEMFRTNHLQVIGGAGNPDYDDDGNRVATPVYEWIGQQHWLDLKNGTNLSGNNALRWPLLQTRDQIEALANNRSGKPPVRVAMIGRGFNGLNFYRAGVDTNPQNPHTKEPFTDPARTDVPTLATLSRAALNVLGQNGRGFYLMIEAGSVDRAEHANDTGRLIEESIESDNTVQAVIDWVNRPDTAATWDDTLLIVTADHDHLLYGPDGATVPFQPLQDRGAGHMPGNRWFGPNHGTGLVPLYAYGRGADQIAALATEVDSYTDGQGRTFGHGRYVNQTVLGEVLKATAAQAR
jgi:alkaline phosphatase